MIEEQRATSVVMTTYNRADCISNSIRSILNQTMNNLELIIVDDGSSDNTQEIVSGFADDRIRYLHLSENVGQSAARNRGIEEARFDIIAFADSDDTWADTKLEHQIPLLDEKHKLVYGAFTITDVYNRTTTVPGKQFPVKSLNGDMKAFLQERNVIGTPTIVTEKKLLQDVRGFDERMRALEDWDLVLRLADKTKFHYLNEIVVHAHSDRFGVNKNINRVLDARLIMLKKRDLYQLSLPEIAYTYIRNIYQSNVDADAYFSKLSESTDVSLDCIKQVLKRCGKELIKEREQYEIIRKLADGEGVKSFLSELSNGQEAIAVYGLGLAGIVLVDKMNELRIPYLLLMDQTVIRYYDERVYSLDEVEENSHYHCRVIITIHESFEKIKTEIEKKLQFECHSIREILEY